MIVVVMDSERDESGETIFSKWLPLIQRLAPKVSACYGSRAVRRTVRASRRRASFT